MPAHSPLLLRHSSLPFARLQTPKTPQTLQFLRGSLVPTDCSMVDSPCPDVAFHISLAKWTPVNYAFLCNNPILNRKFVPTDCSMVYLPRPDIASHISLAKWTPVNDAFLFNNTILNRKFVPTDCSMVYLPCRHVTSYMPIASGTNVVILFRTGESFLDLEIVTALKRLKRSFACT